MKVNCRYCSQIWILSIKKIFSILYILCGSATWECVSIDLLNLTSQKYTIILSMKTCLTLPGLLLTLLFLFFLQENKPNSQINPVLIYHNVIPYYTDVYQMFESWTETISMLNSSERSSYFIGLTKCFAKFKSHNDDDTLWNLLIIYQSFRKTINSILRLTYHRSFWQ